ncbi:hypothetical protein EYF80_005208 [Liparis tanakae]|uniref:Uncharacterized protein n=1 Tax=Liparis tanakae TaxID=230148 RepID=A0A4Z2J492_9TELE|nr:hypothetical protein EYF80_005208 [Liparis tanakae]
MHYAINHPAVRADCTEAPSSPASTPTLGAIVLVYRGRNTDWEGQLSSQMCSVRWTPSQLTLDQIQMLGRSLLAESELTAHLKSSRVAPALLQATWSFSLFCHFKCPPANCFRLHAERFILKAITTSGAARAVSGSLAARCVQQADSFLPMCPITVD